MKYVGKFVADQQLARVHPPNVAGVFGGSRPGGDRLRLKVKLTMCPRAYLGPSVHAGVHQSISVTSEVLAKRVETTGSKRQNCLPKARKLGREDYEALSCRTGLSRLEISHLYMNFMQLGPCRL